MLKIVLAWIDCENSDQNTDPALLILSGRGKSAKFSLENLTLTGITNGSE